MEKLKKTPELAPQTTADRFEALFNSELVETRYEDLPAYVVDHLESQSLKFISPEAYQTGNFDKIYTFTHTNGDVTYIGQQDKTYENTSGSTERLTYFLDTRDGDITGYLEMRLSLTDLDEYFKDKPFVGFTRTHESFQNQGLAARRLKEANAYALSEHGFPLNSDTLLTDEAQRVWERLVAEGKAKHYEEGGNTRFRFI